LPDADLRKLPFGKARTRNDARAIKFVHRDI